ncbi:MAG: hypothetical protein HZB56_02180 [Deltaproteobacteria bacterium]|nr:hypothetical protein [Deltaproteobacteria bacterium]
MAKLVGFLLVVGALAGAAALVPVDGRTVLDRWQAARGPGDFVSRSWREIAVATGLQEPPRRPAAQARTPASQKGQKPVEHHTDADRAALDRLVNDRAGRP